MGRGRYYKMKSISVNISESKKSYNIFIGNDFIGERLSQLEKEGAYFIIDSKVASLYKNIIPTFHSYYK